MKRALAGLAWCLLVGPLPAHGAERDVRRTFPVQPGCTLKIDTYRGVITVAETEELEIAVTVHMEVGGETDADAERVLAGLQLEISGEGNTVSIRARNPRETRARWVWREDEQIGLFYRISVPRQCNVEVANLSGDVTIGRLQGRLQARVRTGTVFFRGVEGSAEVRVEEGEVVVSRCTGALVADVLNGSIRTGLVGPGSRLKTASGSIEVMMTRGGLKAEAVAGGLVVGFAREQTADSVLTTSGGNIVARLDPAARCRVEASARLGRVHADLPLQVETGATGRRRLAGRLNGGGARLALRASGGDVRIEPGETPFE